MGAGGGIRWGWCAAMVAAVLLWGLAIHYQLRNIAEPKLIDFISYWSAGQLALEGRASAAWDVAAHHALQLRAIGRLDGLLPFPYPPPFLLMLLPFSWLPYMAALFLWIGVTAAFFLWQARRVAPLSQGAAQPAVLINALIGQNGFLTAGLFLAGVTRLAERPFLAGAILGLLVIKPHLALMLPVAVVAARAWPAISGAALSASGLLAAALLAFGWESYAAFAGLLPQVSGWMAADRYSWEEFASPFAFLRTIGVASSIAMAVQAAAFIGAAALCWAAWRERWDQRVPILCAASLLGSPYLQSYDTLLMLAPIGWFLARQPRVAALLYLLCLSAVVTQIGLWKAPDMVPVAAVLSLWLMWRERVGKSDGLRLAAAG